MFSFVQGSRDDNVAKDNCRLIEKLAGDRRVRIVHVCDIPEKPVGPCMVFMEARRFMAAKYVREVV